MWTLLREIEGRGFEGKGGTGREDDMFYLMDGEMVVYVAHHTENRFPAS